MTQLFVLDASAVLAFLQTEPGYEKVQAALQNDHCIVTAVNQAEVISKVIDKGIEPSVIESLLLELGYEVVDVSAADGAVAGLMRTDTRDFGLSLGDQICLASAHRFSATVLTADSVWSKLAAPLNLKIICIRSEE